MPKSSLPLLSRTHPHPHSNRAACPRRPLLRPAESPHTVEPRCRRRGWDVRRPSPQRQTPADGDGLRRPHARASGVPAVCQRPGRCRRPPQLLLLNIRAPGEEPPTPTPWKVVKIFPCQTFGSLCPIVQCWLDGRASSKCWLDAREELYLILCSASPWTTTTSSRKTGIAIDTQLVVAEVNKQKMETGKDADRWWTYERGDGIKNDCRRHLARRRELRTRGFGERRSLTAVLMAPNNPSAASGATIANCDLQFLSAFCVCSFPVIF
ncbi:uncharacterized protein [Triticum aestivum]|uniref:uncharacterized protein isoform X2 n=1 Tax=Triticum aestivum TaxID=4565 RepID=UPI001D01376A|nr:uncharacterized protein LOC123188719 isoform X2 [Triticum aestivum]